MGDSGVEETTLALAWSNDEDAAARAVTQGIARVSDVALARLWIVRPGDVCGSCTMRTDCRDRSRCLHLVASAGCPRASREDWEGIQGRWKRLPIGNGKVGRVGATGTAVLLHDMSERSSWIVDPGWAAREEIRSFAAQPVIAGETVLGVLGVFRRSRTDATLFTALRRVADHAAAAVTRARARTSEASALRRDVAVDVPVLSIGEWRQRERANLEAAMRRSGGRIYGPGGAAELLGVPPTTLASRLRALRIPTPGRWRTASP